MNERRGAGFQETWIDGYAFEEVAKRLQRIATERDEIARATAVLRKLKKPSSSTISISALVPIAV